MKKALVLALIGAGVLLLGAGIASSQQNGEDAKFTKFVDTFLDAYWKFYPTAATMNGYSKYNDKLEDLAESNIEKYLAGLDKFNAELVNKIQKDKLGPETQIDYEILRSFIDYDLLRLEKIAPQLTNPLFYNDILYHGLAGLLAKDVDEAKLKSATERLKAIPAFLKQAKENLKTPPKEYTDAAIKRIAAILDFYKTDIPKLVEKSGGEAKAKFQTELPKAVAAVEDYAKFLSGELLSKSTGNFRLGSEAHQRTLQMLVGSTMLLKDIGDIAIAEAKNIRREMAIFCIAYYRLMYPNVDTDKLNTGNEESARTAVIKGVLDKIKAVQPAKEDWLAKIKTATDDVKTFLDKTKILDAPDQELAIEPMNAADRGFQLGRLVGPTPYQKNGSYVYQLNPYADGLAPDQAASFMDEFNDFMYHIWAIRHVYPGSFFPAFFTAKDSSLVRKMNPNPALMTSWPLYVQDMFIFAGFNSFDLKQRLMDLKLKLQALIDFQLDINVHEGNVTKERAMQLMMVNGFQTQAEAERKWNMIVLHPGMASYAYIGYQEILDMEKNYKAAKGDQFNKKEFAQKLLSYGPLPFRFLKEKIGQ